MGNVAFRWLILPRNTSASSGTTEQRDIIRSILMLERQQQQDLIPSSDSDTEVFEDQKKSRSGTARDREIKSPQPLTSASMAQPSGSSAPIAGSRLARKTSIEDEEDQSPKQQNILTAKTEVEVSKDPDTGPMDDSSQNSSEMVTPSGTNRNGPKHRMLSLETQNLQGQENATEPRSQDTAKAVKLRLFTLDPSITTQYALVRIQWYWADSRVPEDEIREMIAKNKADGLKSVFAVLQALHVFEKSHVAGFIREIGDHATLVSLKRTEQDVLEGNITFKAVPSFQLITEQPASKVKSWNSVSERDQSPEHGTAEYILEKRECIGAESEDGSSEILFEEMIESPQHERAHDGEGEKDEYTEAEPEDESEENAAVDELLQKYTTFFDGAA